LPVVKLERKFTLKNVLIPFRLSKSIKIAKKIINEINPDIIFSKGGFVGLPVSVISKKLNIPFILHESDYSMGLSNKIAQKYAKKVLTTFSNTKTKYPEKTICVGSPIRNELKKGDKEKVKNKNKLDKNKKNILVIGGSQGAKFFNTFFIENAKKLCINYNIILITGKQDIINDKLPQNFIKEKNVNNIQDYYNLADIVITRGGANVLFELLYVNKPMLIIPLPTSNSRGDQIQNAEYFVKNGFAEMLLQENCCLDTILNKIEHLSINSNKYKENQKKSNYNNSNTEIIKIIDNL